MFEIARYISGKVADTILRFGMLDPGDRVLVALSGGKDSSALFRTLLLIGSSFPVPFEVQGMHIHTEYCTCREHPELWRIVGSWGGTVHFRDISITERLKAGRKMNCYWCTTQRRTELLSFAEERGFTKIALGHHQDDIIETFFMNMAFKSELSTMLPVMKYDRYPQTIIRPLAMVKERFLADYSAELGLDGIACSCSYDTRSKRRVVRGIIEELASEGEYIKDNIFESMANPNLRYLMTPEAMPGMRAGRKPPFDTGPGR